MGLSDGRNKGKRGARSENTDPALAALEGVHTSQFLLESRNNSAIVVLAESHNVPNKHTRAMCCVMIGRRRDSAAAS